MEHDFFYGSQSESFSFCRIPRQLLTGAAYREISTDAKLLYGLLLDRMGLSAKNGWYDNLNRVYIYYTLDEIQEDFQCGRAKAVRLLKELDRKTGIGLIERKRQGQGKPTMIYVKQFVDTAPPEPRDSHAPPRLSKTELPEVPEEEVQKFHPETSRSSRSGSQEVPKENCNYTDGNQTENSYTDPSIHLSYCPKVERAVIEADVREQIDYPRLAESYPYDDPDSILQLICDILCSTSESIKIGNEQIPASKVKERYRRLDFEHVTYVMDSLRETTTKIKNIRGYPLPEVKQEEQAAKKAKTRAPQERSSEERGTGLNQPQRNEKPSTRQKLAELDSVARQKKQKTPVRHNDRTR